jgi:hypothetical protein
MGRPSEYKPEYAEQARKLCLLGAIDADLAVFFEVSETTINNWKGDYPEFFESVKSGKATADAHVATKLYERATGAEWVEQQAFKVKKTKYQGGKKVLEQEDIVTVPVTKAAPPDTVAAIFWLKNRASDKWRDKVAVEHDVSDSLAERIAKARETLSSSNKSE